MEVSYSEGLASHTGPESCVGVRKDEGEALTGVRTGWVLSRENPCPAARRVTSGCRRRGVWRKARSAASRRRDAAGPCAVRDPRHVRKHLAREPGDPTGLCDRKMGRAYREVERLTPMMNAGGKSDRPKVPGKPSNKAERTAAETVEGRGRTKGKPARAQRTPDTGPGGCAQCARAGTTSG